MSGNPVIQMQYKHCVICGKAFCSLYSEALHAFPVYHPNSGKSDIHTCESRFYAQLLDIYLYLHEQNRPVPMPELSNRIEGENSHLKQDMIQYCIQQGYVLQDSASRIEIPEPLHEVTKYFFAAENLNDDRFRQKVIEYIQSALIVLRNQLKPINESLLAAEEDATSESDRKRIHRMAAVEKWLSVRQKERRLSSS